MNQPIMAALATLAVLTSAVCVIGIASAQYGGTGATGGSTGSATPAQIQECQSLGIPTDTCNDQTILAKKRLTAAQENPSTGSGSPMLSTEGGQMVVFIGVLAAIFGGVAAAFFLKGRGAKQVKT